MGKLWGCTGLLLGVMLGGCGGGAIQLGTGTSTAAPVSSLRSQAQQLPGVELAAGELLRLSYPQLFAAGAALPLAGGVEQLQPLGDFLRQASGSRWQLRLRGEGENGLALAQARAQLLRDYFERRGLAGERLQWQTEAGAGAALELQLASVP